MLEYIPALKMYRSTVPTPPIFELRAWVTIPNQRKKVLCEIWTVSGKDVTLREIKTGDFFMTDRANVHSVHTATKSGLMLKYYGEPKPC